MAEFSVGGRIVSAALAIAAPVAWYVLAPDFDPLVKTPIGSLTVPELISPIVWLLLLIPCLYEAIAGRDHVWFWHPCPAFAVQKRTA